MDTLGGKKYIYAKRDAEMFLGFRRRRLTALNNFITLTGSDINF